MSREKEKLDIEELLSSLPVPPPPEDLARKIRAEIPAQMTVAPFPKSHRRLTFSPWMRSAAAILLVAAGYIGYTLSRPSSSQTPAAVAPRPKLATPVQAVVAPLAMPAVIASEAPKTARHAVPVVPSPDQPALLEALITDENGSALPGVTVKVTGKDGERTTVTDAKGQIALPLAGGGKYKVETQLPGFQGGVEELKIASGETKKFQAPMKLNPVQAGTVVTAESPLLDMQNTVSYQGTPRVELQPLPKAAPKAAPSTGGTREPNDQPYGHVFFRSSGVNPFVDTEDDHLSTFGLDVDSGSYAIARRYLTDGNLPPAEAIRVEEFVNAFDYGEPAPMHDDFAISADAAPTPFSRGDRYRIVRFHLRAKDVDPEDRKAADLVFVVDVSGSMQQENRLELVKKALGLLLDRLRSSDRVGLVVFGTNARVVLEPTGDLEAISSAIRTLVPEGSTNTEEGLRVGYEMAARYRRGNAIHRVILCSDGVANVGRTGPDSILSVIEREVKSGIELTTVGFGMGNYNDVLMEQLADKGHGRYAYVDTLKEARRVFVENLTGMLQTVAADARVQVDFNPSVVTRFRLLGYENRAIPNEKFRDDKVDAGQVGAGHQVTALYEIKLADNAHSGRVATLRLRYRPAQATKFVEVERALRLSQFDGSWDRAPRGLRLAALVAEFAEILKRSYWAKDLDSTELLRRVRQVAEEFPGDAKVEEFVGLVEKAKRLTPPPSLPTPASPED